VAIAPDAWRWMDEAYRLASEALLHGEVPVAAVIVREDKVLAARHNESVRRRSALAHAELLALGDALEASGDGFLAGADVYVTLEPCAMCAGALVLARVRSVTFGAWDPKAGACGSLMNIVSDPRLNHELAVQGGVDEPRSGALLRRFFAEQRTRRA